MGSAADESPDVDAIHSFICCYTTRVAHDTCMYIHKNIQLRNTEYNSTRIAQ